MVKSDASLLDSTTPIHNVSLTGSAVSTPPTPSQKLSHPDNDEATTKMPKRTGRQRIGFALKAYSASLLMVGVMMPIVASLIAVGLYLTLQNSPLPPFLGIQPSSQWNTLVYSTFLSGIFWLVAAIPYCHWSTAQGAKSRNYSLLRSRLHQLKVSLGLKDYADGTYEEINDIDKVMEQAGFNKNNKHQWGVVKEAYACCIDISRRLYKFSVGLPWIIGTEYNSVWTLLHHAEEVMIEVADPETLVRGAKHDFLAIQGSQIDGQDELLEDVIQAVTVIQPEALPYFKEHQISKSSVALSQLTQLTQQSNASSLVANVPSKNGADSDARMKANAAARATLREVRSALNDFRDKRWEGLVRQRSRLLMSIAITGIMTHALLGVTILTGALLTRGQLTSLQSGIMAATMFYVVGAVAGLFVRFYSESQGGTSMDDFGLSITRLAAIPLLSGLAGIGGVLVSVMLASLGGPTLLGSTTEKTVILSTLFTPDPRLLLAAAIFGVTPNLLIRGLKQKADEYATELKSSTSSITQAGGTKM